MVWKMGVGMVWKMGVRNGTKNEVGMEWKIRVGIV